MEEKILDKILSKLDNLGGQVGGVVTRLGNLEGQVGNLAISVVDVEKRLSVKIDNLEGQIDVVAIKVVGMEERMDTFATKDDLLQIKDEILGKVDRFVKLHETLDTELSALRSKSGRLEERLIVVEHKLQLA